MLFSPLFDLKEAPKLIEIWILQMLHPSVFLCLYTYRESCIQALSRVLRVYMCKQMCMYWHLMFAYQDTYVHIYIFTCALFFQQERSLMFSDDRVPFCEGHPEQTRGSLPKIAVQVAVLRRLCSCLHGFGGEPASCRSNSTNLAHFRGGTEMYSDALAGNVGQLHHQTQARIMRNTGTPGTRSLSRWQGPEYFRLQNRFPNVSSRLILGLQYYLVITTLIQYRLGTAQQVAALPPVSVPPGVPVCASLCSLAFVLVVSPWLIST